MDHLGQQVFALEAAPSLRRGGDQLENHHLGGLLRQRSLGAEGPVPHGGEHAFDGIRGPDVIPVLGGEIVEGEQRVAVLGQALHRLGVLGRVLLHKYVQGGLRRGPIRRHPDLPQVLLHRRLHGLGNLVQHVGGLVHCADRSRFCQRA